jgi:hypothetical protein
MEWLPVAGAACQGGGLPYHCAAVPQSENNKEVP